MGTWRPAASRTAPHGACDCVPGAGCPSSPKCTPKNVLWLPLGDSITWGCNGPTIQDCHADSGSYRVPLAFALTQHPLGSPDNVGYNISTMGTLTTGPPYVPAAWLKHEGHPGWQINTIDNILNRSLATSPVPPDLVTIHLGASPGLCVNSCGYIASIVRGRSIDIHGLACRYK